MTVEEAREKISANSELTLLDLRMPSEVEKGKIEGALMVDEKLGQEIVSSWPRDRQIIVYCQHGERSLTTTQFLRTQGFQNVFTLSGGFEAWAAAES
ncbi:MAG: rhodanese-like domain-containing protein [Acidobacteria bacterium]|nr:rhodanese-like domain-containing protein [Acidobacteriota bacterium]